MSIGTDRVRAQFNPSNNHLVDTIKFKTAELIDLCEQHKHLAARYGELPAPANNEMNRLWSLAQTNYEDAAMWAVKAATAKLDDGGDDVATA